MSRTGVLHGAIVLLRKDNKIVGLAREPAVNIVSPLAAVEPIGQPHVEELLRTGVEISFEFTLYRAENRAITSQGFFPSQKSVEDFINHPEMRLQIESKSKVILHRLEGCQVEDVSVRYSKGEAASYSVSGKATRHYDEGDL